MCDLFLVLYCVTGKKEREREGERGKHSILAIKKMYDHITYTEAQYHNTNKWQERDTHTQNITYNIQYIPFHQG